MTAHRLARACAVLTGLTLVALPGGAATAGTVDPSPAASAATSSTTSTAPAGPTTVTTSEGVEVTTYGTVQVRGYQRQDEGVITIAVHGVRRVEGGTVVYASVAFSPEQDQLDAPAFNENVSTQIGGRFGGGGGVTGFRVVEPGAGRVLSILREPGDGVLTGALSTGNAAFPSEPDQLGVVYAVMPELDPATETVDVQVGFGQVVTGVPVEDGPLEPTLPADSFIPVGTGWPEIDLAAVADAPEPEKSVHELVTVQQSLDQTTTTTETTEEVSIDVAADVLFAFDSADLSGDARATLERVGAEVVDRAAGGTLRVVGHTDSQGSDAYNIDLSQRRAAAAAEVLRPFAERAGLTVETDGRGEAEPVADNGTDEGRQANRRVTVTFDVAEEG